MGTFNIGQKVVYIMQSLPEIGLIKDKVYEVIDLADCKCAQNLHVGIIEPTQAFTYCPDCGGIINIDDRWFFNEEAFRPIVAQSEEVEIEEQFFNHLTTTNMKPHEEKVISRHSTKVMILDTLLILNLVAVSVYFLLPLL